MLEGTVNPNGALVTECRFEYEPEAGLHQSAPCVQSVGEGSGSVTVSATISGLTPARTYGFVLVAASGAGSMSGGLGTFTTPALPSVWTFGGYASSSTAMQQYTTAMLNGQAAGDGTAVTDCHFEYGGSPSLGASVPCAQPVGAGWTPVPVSAAITSLLWSSTYYDRLVATNGGGTSYGTIQAFATPALPVVSSPVPYAPSAPTPNFWYSATENTISQNSTSTSPPHRTSAAAARCAKLHGRRRSHCYAALRHRAGSNSDEGLYVAFCPDRARSGSLRATAAGTSEAGWPAKECLKMDKGPPGEHHTIVGEHGVHNWLLGGYGSDTILGGNIGDVIWADYHPSGEPKHQTAWIRAGNGRNVIYANDTVNYVWTGTNPKTVVHAHLTGISGVIHCQSPSIVVFLSTVSERHFALDGCHNISHYSVGY